MRTIRIRVYKKDLERINYLFCKELKEVDINLSKRLRITQPELINFLLQKIENDNL